MRGRFVVFEGGEGGGKTTQLERSRQWLVESGWLERLQAKGYVRDLVVTREPGGTEVGRAIRQLLLNHSSQEAIQDRAELLLYAADRAQHVEGFLRPQLEAGALILCDRYTDSTVAYQGYGRGLDLTLINQLNQIASGGLESDLTFWLDLPCELGLARTQQRGTSDRIEQADLTFHQQVQKGFAQLAQQHPQRIVRIDASQPKDLVTQHIQAALIQSLTRWFGV
ncbi:MAG: dTMP kinase [Oscillatoriales cyanobacterium C42_A2020_001]|nr:dTMP kinase [Leptolyngbyaceae cyanobacterium C42_A2020_001]